jgi:hydroxyacylglutathione hydrolase
MVFERFDVPGLSHYSYIVGCGGAVAVIDPKRDIDTYLEFAERTGLRIAYVLETHIHADYASGARALADATGAELCLSAYDEGETFDCSFPHKELRDGDEITMGKIKLRAWHTPGHTPEHMSFLLSEPERGEHPLALFSGDFLFIGSVGRPDLLGEVEKLELAKKLYRSVQNLAALPDGLMIFPGHGAGSLCGAGMAQRDQSTLGYERATNPFLQPQTEQTFIDTVLGTVPEFPDYYRRMKKLNSVGAPAFAQLPGGEQLKVKEFEAKLQDTNAVVLDLRRPEAFGGAHIPRSINIGAGNNLSMWAAWVLSYDQPILLVGDATTDLDAARRSLVRVGLDSAVGSLRGGIAAWLESGREQAHVPQVSVRELQAAMANPDAVTVLDVRNPIERKSGHIEGTLHISGGDLPKQIAAVPAGKSLYVICGSGYRSSVSASVLAHHGRVAVTNVNGGMSAWKSQGLPVVMGA